MKPPAPDGTLMVLSPVAKEPPPDWIGALGLVMDKGSVAAPPFPLANAMVARRDTTEEPKPPEPVPTVIERIGISVSGRFTCETRFLTSQFFKLAINAVNAVSSRAIRVRLFDTLSRLPEETVEE